jgi:hypothetical protein
VNLAVFAAMSCLALGLPAGALAASQPAIESTSVSYVSQHDAGLQAWINPKGLSARGAVYQFQVVADPSEYLSEIACSEREHSGLGGGGCIGTPTHGVLPIGSIPDGTESRQAYVNLLAAGVALKPGSTYHFRVLAATAKVTEDTLEWEAPPAYSEDRTFTTPPATTTPVVVESESASHVSATDATLAAKINPENLEHGALYQFQLARNTNEYFPVFVCPAGWAHSSICLGLDDEVEGLPTEVTHAGQAGQVVSLDLAHAGVTLKPGTTYHYRVIAATSVFTEDTTEWEGPTAEGADQTFTTPSARAAPSIESVSISHLTPSDATLEAQINTEDLATTYEFQLWSSPCSKHGAGCELIEEIPLPSGLLLGSIVGQSVSLDLNSAGVTLGGGEYGFSVRATNREGGTEADGGTFEAPSGVLDPLSPVVSPRSGGGPSMASSNGAQLAGTGSSSSSSFASAPGVQSAGLQVGKTIKPASLTSAQKLAKALKVCKGKSKSRRAACERQARAKYGTTSSKAKRR